MVLIKESRLHKGVIKLVTVAVVLTQHIHTVALIPESTIEIKLCIAKALEAAAAPSAL